MGNWPKMHKIPFIIGNFIACLIPWSKPRRNCRGYVNRILFYPWIARFIRRAYGERMKSLRFVRQRTLHRVVFIVNNKYYVKIFRNVTHQRVCDFVELMGMVERVISVEVPHFIADKSLPMIGCAKNTGTDIHLIDKKLITENQDKIKKQVQKIIQELQSIDVESIPNSDRFINNIQGRHKPEVECAECHRVLGHFDMNPSNFLFDENLNIASLIDWDSMQIANNPDSDWLNFTKNWKIFLSR
jgi:hypothetical protein